MRVPGTGLYSRLGGFVERIARGRLGPGAVRAATVVVAAGIAFGIVGFLVSIQLTSTPRFCGSCHIMKPYYASWETSSHCRIACVECHISPGVTAELRKKYEALSMVAKYFTATYGTKPWAEVEDAACLRCHDRRLLQGKVDFHGVSFDHTPHLTELRRGMQLHCTSCHGQIVQGQHITVTVTTCALCHFKDQPANAGLGRCQNCHSIPNRVMTAAGGPFDHSQVESLGMDCRSCHPGVVRGDGYVPRERCLSCHNQPDRLEKFGDVDLLHEQHVAVRKVDCVECHLVIEHGASPTNAITEQAGDCTSCHGGGHSPQADLYAGRGGRGVPAMPSPMFAAGVGCDGCHNPQYSAVPASTGSMDVHSTKATEVSCMACHGPGYKSIYDAWKQGVDARLGALRGQLDQTVAAFGISGPKAFEDARHNYLLVEQGRGVHNVTYSYALLDKAQELMNEARREKGLSPLPRPWSVIAPGSGSCMSCHAGIESQAGTFAGHRFEHRRHLVDAGLECDACHRPHAERAPGEVVRFGDSGCMACHHEGMKEAGPACEKCHGDVRTRTVPSWRGEFSHEAHLGQGLECGGCHPLEGGDVRPPQSVCADCHG